MPNNPIEQKLDACRADVDRAIADIHRRVESVEQIQSLIHQIFESTQATEQRVNNLMISFSSYAAKQSEMDKAFPANDLDGHRRAHEAWIKKAEASAAFWQKLRDEAVKYGILGAIGFVATAVWLAIKADIHK